MGGKDGREQPLRRRAGGIRSPSWPERVNHQGAVAKLRQRLLHLVALGRDPGDALAGESIGKSRDHGARLDPRYRILQLGQYEAVAADTDNAGRWTGDHKRAGARGE